MIELLMSSISALISAPYEGASYLADASRLFQPLQFFTQIATDGGGDGESLRGAVGNMVTAYLQTKGLIDQAKILTDFATTLDTIAALFWLFSISLAIGSVAVLGSYREGLYLLIGPALFFFMVQSTASTNGVELRFGDFTVNNAAAEEGQMLRHIRAIGEDGSTTVEVSRFFALWDAIVSEAVQAVVALLVDTENKDHLRFVARERMLNYVLNSTADSPGFIRLIGAIYVGECSRAMPDLQRLRALERQEIPLRVSNNQSENLARERFEKIWEQTHVPLDVETKTFILAMKNGGIPGFTNVPLNNVLDTYTPTCKEVWGFIESAAKHVAQRRVTWESFTRYFTQADTSEIPQGKVLEDLQELLARSISGEKSARDKSIDYVSSFMLKNTLERSSVQMLTSQAFGRTPFNSSYDSDVMEVLSKTEGHGGFMKLKYFAESIPYIQGMLLYLLSISFPFFAIFLVVPSRATSFLGWMGLWAWVKSWDVGFAAVHVVREILWKFLESRVNLHAVNLDWAKPETVISLLYNNDPFYSQNTYWMITSSLTLAIPFITAHFFLGATGMFDMFSGTIDQTATRFGQTERSRSRRFVANVNEHLQRVSAARHGMARALASEQHESLSPEEKEAAKKAGSLNEGPTDIYGKNVVGALWGGRSSHQMLHSAAEYNLGRLYAQIGTPQFKQQLNALRASAVQNGQAFITRGTLTDEARVAPEIRDKDGNLRGHDMRTLKFLFGDTEMAQELANRGVTWGELDAMQADYQLHNQALTGAITGRRMLNPLRFSREIVAPFNAIQNQQAAMMRGSGAASMIGSVEGMPEALSWALGNPDSFRQSDDPQRAKVEQFEAAEQQDAANVFSYLRQFADPSVPFIRDENDLRRPAGTFSPSSPTSAPVSKK